MGTIPKTVDAKIRKMVKRIVRRFDPERVILFGSYAKGVAKPDSDVDLMVVLSFSGSKRAKQVEMRLAVHDVRVPKDIVVVSPDEFEKRRDIVGTIIYPAVREGKALYVKHG